MTPTPSTFDALRADLGAGLLLLEASAGTGKTWSLTTLAARMLLEGRIDDVGELLMVTFTNAATDDLRSRLRERLSECLEVALGRREPDGDEFLARVATDAAPAAVDRFRRAIRDFDRVRVQTIHSYCAQLLGETAFEAGLVFDLGEPADGGRLRRVALEDAWREIVVEGPSWLTPLAVEWGWTPDTFADALDEIVKHRNLELRPHARSLDELDARWSTLVDRLEAEDVAGRIRSVLDLAEENGGKSIVKAGRERLVPKIRGVLARLGRSDLTVVDRRELWAHLSGGTLANAVNKTFFDKHVRKVPEARVIDELDTFFDPVEVTAAVRRRVVDRALVRLRENKRRDDVVDFDDLIQRVREGLADPARREGLVRVARAGTKAALIDEFQDTDVDQWSIFRALFGERTTLVLVGDPKQAIYGFRGADVFAYLDARDEVRRSQGVVARLDRNYRSHPGLVEAVNVLFGAGEIPFAEEEIQYDEVHAHRSADDRGLEGDPGPAFRLVQIREGDSSRDVHVRIVIERVVAEIRRLLATEIHLRDGEARRRLGPRDVTVLTRSHGQSRLVHRALREAGIAAVLGRSGDVHQSEAMHELGLLLEAILDPRDQRVVRRALATRLWGGSVGRLAAIERDEREMADVVEILDDLRGAWHRFGVLVALDRFLERQAVAERLMGEPEGDRLLTDLRHALELVHQAALASDLSPVGTLHWLWRERGRDHPGDEQRELRLDRDDDAVNVVTVHASKGLEYEVVLVPFAWVGKEPKSPLQWHAVTTEGRRRVLDHTPSKECDARDRGAAVRESLAEDLRLLYVALTRARRRCVVFMAEQWGQRSPGTSYAALTYLLHRAARHEGESAAEYVDRCVETLKSGPEHWQQPLAPWLRDRECLGDLPTPATDLRPPPPRFPAAEPRARELPHGLGARVIPWSMVSFTSLQREASVDDGGALLEVDGDEAVVAERADPASIDRRLRASTPTGIFAFAKGARAGVCLHEILEHADFSRDLDDDGRAAIERSLEVHGLASASAHVAPIDPQGVAEELVTTVRHERLPLGDFRFADVDPAHRLDEWEFRTSLGGARARTLADLFERHVDESFTDAVVRGLRRLSDRRLAGLLGGFVDLLFVHDGRWYVVDWKSNHLGDHVDDYDEASVVAAMVDHGYVLQLVLYTAAVHRYLTVRRPGYDYDAHVGGGAYAFLRGLCGRADRGWFAWKPPRALVEAVDAWMGRGRA